MSKAHLTHGHATQNNRTSEYRCWVDMKTRCTNRKRSNWKDYGGRGIKVCQRWRESFAAFLADMGPRPSRLHSIDRKNNDGDYEPGNCQWATAKVQQSNMRSNHLIAFGGETLCLSEWARRIGRSRSTLNERLRRGWPLHLALVHG